MRILDLILYTKWDDEITLSQALHMLAFNAGCKGMKNVTVEVSISKGNIDWEENYTIPCDDYDKEREYIAQNFTVGLLNLPIVRVNDVDSIKGQYRVRIF